ncbi:hypothetical protein Dimus_006334 [Dionaea muscipula]
MGGCPLQSERQNLTTWNSREIICQRKESLLKDELMQIAGNNGNSGEIRCLEHELDLNNVALVLLEAGLARIQTTFGICRISDGHLLVQAEELAKQQKLQIWEDYVEGQEVANGSAAENKQKEVLQLWWQGCGILTSGRTFKARIEVRDTSGGTAKGQGTGTILMVTLLDAENDSSINEEMLKV